jgi:hypothetical protein
VPGAGHLPPLDAIWCHVTQASAGDSLLRNEQCVATTIMTRAILHAGDPSRPTITAIATQARARRWRPGIAGEDWHRETAATGTTGGFDANAIFSGSL